ncbi:MAG: DUF5723 family protein [Prevotellaceae bacterium]|jgi:hypothetical protein|nr:DUF5723 family protein [Prevotellaceae bacterium]
MKQFYTATVVALLSVAAAHAQLNPTLYHIKDLPLNSQLNPAFQPRNGSVYVGVPGLTSFSSSLMLSGKDLTIGNYIDGNYKGSMTSADKFSSVIGDFEYNLINFGFMVKDMYFSFDSKVKYNFDGRIPKDLQKLIWYGNGAPETLGKTLSLEGLGISASAYGEISLGMSKEIKENLFVGAKIKYLQGLANAQVGLGEGSDFTTEESAYKISVGLNPDIFLAGLPVTTPQGSFPIDSLTNAEFGDYTFDAGNRGVAFDLGGSWDLPWVKGLNVSASVLDLGFISWKGSKVASATPEQKISFDGLSLSDGADFVAGLLDSVQQKTAVKSASVSERRWLSPTMYVGANYEVAKYLNVGGLFGYRFSQYRNLPMFALSANTQGFMVNGSVSYSYYNHNSNVGAGVVIGRKGVQWHIIADNLLAAASFKTAQNVNFRMGLNLLFGKGREKRIASRTEGSALDATSTGADASPAQQPDKNLQDTLNVAPIRPQSHSISPAKQAKPVAQEAATPAKAQENLSKEELLKRALVEEMEADEDLKKNVKRKPSVAPKSEKDSLLQRTLREEAGDRNVRMLQRALPEEAGDRNVRMLQGALPEEVGDRNVNGNDKKLAAATVAAASSAAPAQNVYIRAGGGYSFGAGKASGAWDIPGYNISQTSDNKLIVDKTSSSSSSTRTNASFSLGKGISYDFGLGYMFNPYIGFELGVRGLSGLDNTVEDKSYSSQHNVDETSSSYSKYNTTEIKSSAEVSKIAYSGFALVPALRVAAPLGETFSVYSRIGVSLPLSGKATYTKETSAKRDYTGSNTAGKNTTHYNIHTSSSSEEVAEITSYFKAGYAAALGVDVAFGKHFSLFGEVNALAASFEMKKKTLTKSASSSRDNDGNVTNTDKLAGLEDWQKITEYKKEYSTGTSSSSSSSSSGASNTPAQSVSYTLPASSVGLTVGLTIKF